MQNLGNAERVLESIVVDRGLPQPVALDDSLVERILSPFDMFHWLRTSSPRRFAAHMGAKPEGLEAWWAAFLERPACQEFRELHPWLRNKTPSDLKRHVPCLLFDDAGPVSATSSTFVRVFYSLVGNGSERETRYLIATGLKDGGLPDRSWPIMLDEFGRLAQPVAGDSWGAVLLFIGADLEYICNVLGYPHFNSPAGLCTYCLANETTIPHNSFHADAAWRGTLVSNDEFLERIRRPLHPVTAHPVFSIYTYRCDLLHMLDHHGVSSHVVANVFWTHLSGDRDCDVLPGDNMEDRLAFLNADISAFYTHARVQNRLPRLNESNIKAEDFPELKGNAIKAANTKGVVPYVLALQRRAVALHRSPRNVHMLKAAESLQACYDVLYGSGHFLDEGASASLNRHLTRLGQNYQLLALMAFREGKMRWKTVPKLHYVCAHLGDQARLINPRFVQGYGSESMVGRVCEVYAASQHGPFHARIQSVAMLKYRTGLQLLWD